MNVFSYLKLSLFLCSTILCANPINKKETIELGGIKQYITFQGSNAKNPLLLILHGGPGNSVISYADTFTKELQQHFVVAHWDQRGSGKTAKISKSITPVTVSIMSSDLLELVNHLRKRFEQDKIYVMGHSWGGFLALDLSNKHPELLHACFALAPMVNQLESERQALIWMKEQAQTNPVALTELGQVHIPFENGTQLFIHRKWLAQFSGASFPSQKFVEAWAKTWLPLFNEASQVNYFAAAPTLLCPVYFFVGSTDRQTNSTITQDYFNAVKANKKELFWFNNSSHNLTITEPDKLQQIVIDILKR